MISCVKHDSDPGCEVKGTWMGRWTAGTQEGTWLCNANNEGTNFGGYVFAWFDFPLLENHGLVADGTLRDSQISLKHYFSGATITVKGSVTDSSASGNFSVSGIGVSGSWQGKKMPMLNILATDSFTLDVNESYIYGLACDAERNRLYIASNNEIMVYGYNGGLIRTFNVVKTGNPCFDGNHLWFCNGSYGKIIETDTLGNALSEFQAPNSYSDAIMVDGENLKVSSGYSRKIYSFSKVGTSLGSHDYAYLNISGFGKYGNGYLAISQTFPGTLFSMNSSGVPVRAFRFTNGNLYGLAIDGEDVWCISQRYIMSSNNPPRPPTTDIKLYKLKLI